MKCSNRCSSIFLESSSPKYVHLTNEQFYESDPADVKDGIYDLSTTASSSTTNTITTSHTVLNRLMHSDERNHAEAPESHHNGASTSKKSLKLSPPQHHYTNSSNLVTVMMDDKSHDTEDHSFYMPLRRDNNENGHHPMEYEEGKRI